MWSMSRGSSPGWSRGLIMILVSTFLICSVIVIYVTLGPESDDPATPAAYSIRQR